MKFFSYKPTMYKWIHIQMPMNLHKNNLRSTVKLSAGTVKSTTVKQLKKAKKKASIGCSFLLSLLILQGSIWICSEPERLKLHLNCSA